MNDGDDIEAERAAERVVASFRAGASKLPLRASFVEALGVEARPAIHALLFALATDRATDVASLEHHETMAMLALLGRSFAMEGATPTAALGVVPALLDAFRAEGFEVAEALYGSLSIVFLEGFVRGREERLRADFATSALAHVVLLEPLPHVGIVVLRGEHDPEALATHLESIARQAFSRELAACVVDAACGPDGTESADPILHFAGLMMSVGTHIVFVGPAADAWRTTIGAEARPTLNEGVERALHHARLIVRDDRSFVIPFRGILRGRAAPRR